MRKTNIPFIQEFFSRSFAIRIILASIAVAAIVSNYAIELRADNDSSKSERKRTKDGDDVTKPKKPDRPNNSAASGENRNRAIQAIREGRHDAARALIRAAIKATDSTSVKHSWRIVESELDFSSKQYAKSALIAMRIVILTPESEQVGAAYFRAGRAYEKMGRAAKAIEMFEACEAHRSTGELTKKKASKRIEVLKAASEKK